MAPLMTHDGSLDHSPRGGRLRKLVLDDTGAVTAEYAIVLLAAVAFAGLLVTILRSGEVKQILTDLIRQALSVG